MTTSLGTLLGSAVDIVKNDAIKSALPVVQQFLNSIIANPSEANILAQAGAFQVNLLAALPNLEAALASDLAKFIQVQINTLLSVTGQGASVSPASGPPPAAAS